MALAPEVLAPDTSFPVSRLHPVATVPGVALCLSSLPPPPIDFFYRISQLLFGFALCRFHLSFGLAYVRTLEEGIPQSWENVHYTRPEVEQAEAVITWHGELIRSYAVQAASEKITRLANETITMLREKREKVVKEDGSIAARAVIARMGKAELRTDAMKREQVIDLLVTHRHLIPVARKGHYMMMVPHV